MPRKKVHWWRDQFTEDDEHKMHCNLFEEKKNAVLDQDVAHAHADSMETNEDIDVDDPTDPSSEMKKCTFVTEVSMFKKFIIKCYQLLSNFSPVFIFETINTTNTYR